MAVELIITSVRKGLDGGSGYQPVLRTRDLKPAVAERLQVRSGYSHPFPHGDRRNPVVFVHRIERVAGETLHVLARICDAGSDHTGRSNFLAQFVAMDEAEARRKSAGPAEVTRRIAFRAAWDEPAREVDPPTVVGGDRQPGPCQAWKSASLDPGIAGDLAEAAMAGRDVTLISRESDDVLALFADALALVAPAKRWQVTFNTCRIEPFDGTWQAIRSDLPQAKTARSSPGVIDLATNPRGGNGAYAAYARGDSATLPWQVAAKPTPSAGAPSDHPERGAQPPHLAGTGAGPVVPPVVGPRFSEVSPPPPKRRPGMQFDDAVPAKESVDGFAVVGRRLMWLALALVGLLPLLVGVAVLMKPDLLPDWATGSSVADITLDVSNDTATSLDLGEHDRARRKREPDRLAEQKRQEQERQNKANTAAAAEAKATEEKKRQAEELRAEREQKDREREQDETKKRAAEAFAALQTMPTTLVQDLTPAGVIDHVKYPVVDLGSFAVEALLEPGFALATPRDQCDGSQFKARVEKMPGDQWSWRILADSRPVDGGAAQPLHLATLTARDGHLSLTAADKNAAKNPRFNLLRRSVLLVKACDPAQPNGEPTVQRAIQLLQPAKGALEWKVSLLDRAKQRPPYNLPRVPGTTVIAPESKAAPALPLDSTITYELRFDYPLHYKDGTPLAQPVVSTFDSPDFCPLLECPPPNKDKPDQRPQIGVDVTISFPEGAIGIRPEVQGPGHDAFDLEKLAELIGKPGEFDEQLNKTISKVKFAVAKIQREPVAVFRNSAAEKTIVHLVADNRPMFEEFFKRHNLFPERKDDAGKRLDTHKDRVERWYAVCGDILDKATQETADAGAVAKEWQSQLQLPLSTWLEYYEKTTREDWKQGRRVFEPLKSPVTLVVTGLSSPAYDADGKRYDVVLATHSDNQQSKRSGATTTDLD